MAEDSKAGDRPLLPNTPPLAEVSLDDKYDLSKERVFLTGTQALVRLTMMQQARDAAAGLNTAGYVTGYRGSPLGAVDQQFQRAAQHLQRHNVVFQSGLNEELAATACWGTQQAEMRGEGKYDGVFSIWYGKGPGVDRAGDAFRHANFAGTSKHGGVLALMGDDHVAESSTTAHQSEFHFVDVMIPILNPAGVQEILDYGLYGWAMSRFTGAWTALKCMKDTVESTAVVDSRLDRVSIILPEDFALPPGGLNIRPRDVILEQEARLHDYKRDAMLAFIRANKLNRMIFSGGRQPRLGIITVGKSYLDVRQALDDLGIDEVRAADLGLRLYKVGCPWPLGRDDLMDFARGLDLVMVVEEKRSLIEVQVREELYGAANQPVVIGKRDEEGRWLFPVKGALDPNDIALAIGRRLAQFSPSEDLAARLARLEAAQTRLAEATDVAVRIPYFCSGCPHNSSTVVPEGMRAYAGIGCHYMVQWMDRSTEGFTQMGGEGANWIGEAPFSRRPHVFQNLGDGTYNHSGYLAIRAASASGVNVTYKILYNDAVAMTGGQRHDGNLTVSQIALQVAAEGAKRVVVVTDEPDKYPAGTVWPPGLSIHPRGELDTIQRELAAIPGLTVLIYDQTCAAEKRRRRKRGTFPDPDRRMVINELVCEGCGDCGVASNCVSVQPLETEFGRKRQIDQTSCNKDFSCVKGFCPSFVSVSGAKPRRGKGVGEVAGLPALPEPELPALHRPYAVIVSGIGGTGIVTISQVLGTAAHIEGKAAAMIDMAGLAQKGGAVFSHMKIASAPEDIKTIRVAAGEADLVIAGDLVVAGARKVLAAMAHDRATAIVNTAESFPGDFTRNADLSLPAERLKRAVAAAGGERTRFLDASKLANALLGSTLGQNFLLLGFAYQKGAVPISAAAILRAIELNGEAVAMNKAAFDWGRRLAHDPASVESLIGEGPAALTEARRLSQSLDEMIHRRASFLTGYQNAAYAARYQALVDKVATAEKARAPGLSGLSEAVARYAFKLMAYKDEYEVARLYSDGAFLDQVKATFEGEARLTFHLAPPLIAPRDPATGLPKKMSFGPWMLKGFRLLASLKGLRGTPFDLFGYHPERRLERRLIGDYFALTEKIIAGLTPDNHAIAVALTSVPEKIRGYGHVKARHLAEAMKEQEKLLEDFSAPPPVSRQAAE